MLCAHPSLPMSGLVPSVVPSGFGKSMQSALPRLGPSQKNTAVSWGGQQSFLGVGKPMAGVGGGGRLKVRVTS